MEAFLHASEQPDYTREGLSKWRDEGGTLSIRSFEYGTAKTGLTLNGDVTLDENLKPLGAFDANIANIEGLMRTLAENENIPQIARQLLLGQAQWATSLANRALEVDPENSHALYQRACAHAESGATEEALRDLQNAIDKADSLRLQAGRDISFESLLQNERFLEMVVLPPDEDGEENS